MTDSDGEVVGVGAWPGGLDSLQEGRPSLRTVRGTDTDGVRTEASEGEAGADAGKRGTHEKATGFGENITETHVDGGNPGEKDSDGRRLDKNRLKSNRGTDD